MTREKKTPFLQKHCAAKQHTLFVCLAKALPHTSLSFSPRIMIFNLVLSGSQITPLQSGLTLCTVYSIYSLRRDGDAHLGPRDTKDQPLKSATLSSANPPSKQN